MVHLRVCFKAAPARQPDLKRFYTDLIAFMHIDTLPFGLM